MLTFTAAVSSVDTCACNQHIIHDCEDTFASDPGAVLMLHLTVRENCGFIKLHSTSMDRPCGRNLVWMQVVPARLVPHLVRLIPQDIFYGI